jgi:hypothetical protein
MRLRSSWRSSIEMIGNNEIEMRGKNEIEELRRRNGRVREQQD